MARLRERDESAFAMLVGAWSTGMLELARSFVLTNDLAAEVVQETWLAVIQGIEQFEGQSSLRTWVYRILVGVAKRHGVRHGGTVPVRSLPTDGDEDPAVDPLRFRGLDEPYPGHWREFPAPWPSPEAETLDGDVRAQVATALAQLPARQRMVITLRDVEGYSSEEVSLILDTSTADQGDLLRRARAFVRAKLEEYFAAAGSTENLSRETQTALLTAFRHWRG